MRGCMHGGADWHTHTHARAHTHARTGTGVRGIAGEVVHGRVENLQPASEPQWIASTTRVHQPHRRQAASPPPPLEDPAALCRHRRHVVDPRSSFETEALIPNPSSLGALKEVRNVIKLAARRSKENQIVVSGVCISQMNQCVRAQGARNRTPSEFSKMSLPSSAIASPKRPAGETLSRGSHGQKEAGTQAL